MVGRVGRRGENTHAGGEDPLDLRAVKLENFAGPHSKDRPNEVEEWKSGMLY